MILGKHEAAQLRPYFIGRKQKGASERVGFLFQFGDTGEQLFALGVDGIFTDSLGEFAVRFPHAIREPA